MVDEPDVERAVAEVMPPEEEKLEGAAEGRPRPSRGPGGRFARTSGKPGRPKGSKNKPKSVPKEEPEPPSDADIALVGLACGTVWRIAGKFLKLTPLAADEQFELGRVTIPVIEKYLPGMDAWAAEFALAATLVALIELHREEKQKTPQETGAFVPTNPPVVRPGAVVVEPDGTNRPVKFPPIPSSSPLP